MTQFNYYNYFTEIEEHFQRTRGTSLFLLSPLDWALIESWKNADVPLEAVLRGTGRATVVGDLVTTPKSGSPVFGTDHASG